MNVEVLSIDGTPGEDPYRKNTSAGYMETLRLWIDPAARAAQILCESTAPGVGTPEEEWNGRTICESIPEDDNLGVDENEAEELLSSPELQVLLATVCDGHTVSWDGNNHIGRLSDEAEEALNAILAQLRGISYEVSLMNTEDWLSGGPDIDIAAIDDLDELDAYEERLDDIARECEPEEPGLVLTRDIHDCLQDWIDERRSELEEDAA